ncbi:tripartite tricarboxylate transporter TctB family protein [Alphaproteobacteria bacterium]|nr:tripartite tricarboxylate transporter TctB family protein [Alphaproteobacteria bacterium]
MSEGKEQAKPPFEEDRHGGKYLLGGMAVAAAVLLALHSQQTVDGATVSGDADVGWWAEPGLSPAVFLILTFLASTVAFFAAKREAIDWKGALSEYGRVALLSGCMIGTVFLLKIVGFGLSILVFAAVVAFIAGFRGGRLIAIAFAASLSMVLIFRVGFSVWFPRPELFKLIDLPFWLQRVL